MKEIPLLKINSLVKNLFSVPSEFGDFSIFKIGDTPRRLREGNPFRNDFYALVFLLEGTIEFTIDFRTYHLSSNSSLFITPGQVLSTKDNVKDGFGILFKKEFLMEQGALRWLQSLPMFHSFHSDPWINLDKSNTKRLVDLLHKMLGEISTNKDYKYDAIKAYLILTLIQVARLYKGSKQDGNPESLRVVWQYESLINENYREMRNVRDYAELLFMTPQNLNRICKKATSKSASDLINEKLLVEIKRYLIYTEKAIEEIAYAHNFYDNSYFTKYFKKAEGLTPSQYRLKNKKESS